MEDVLGGYTNDARFAAFLANWATILARRVAEATAALSQVEGLHGLILAGGVGRGAAWPLSDIDLIPVYADGWMAEATAGVEPIRLALLEQWVAEGWWSGLDVGRLHFAKGEVRQALSAGAPALPALLADDRWYHSLDKAFGSRALIDPDGVASELADWCTAHRFTPEVVAYRLEREERELLTAQHAFEMAVHRGDMLAATGHLRNAVRWLFTLCLERWGERDNSLGRIGTRFATAALAHGAGDLVDAVHTLSDLTAPQVWQRLGVAPRWVRERHDRSLRARLHVGELIAPPDDARDTLRVCSHYGLRREYTPPYPEWLAVLNDEVARARVGEVKRLIAVTVLEPHEPQRRGGRSFPARSD